MEREIKFRAWHKTNKVMFENKDISVLAKNMNNNGGFIYMQYVGLKDKNGKEIYEGDILKSFYGVGTYTVIFKHGTFGMQGNSDYLDDWNRPKNYGYSSFKDCDNGNIEIIGNIYENHELLK
jgi:uncharacterized phage protein (TIGR01671 family)